MMNGPLSDLSASLRQQTQVARLRADLTRAGTELTTGQIADVRDLGGTSLREVFGLDRTRSSLEATLTALRTASSRADATQGALAKIDTVVGTLGLDLQGAIERGDPVAVTARVSDARGILESVVSALNTSYGGLAVFSGRATDAVAIPDLDAMISDVGAIIAGAPDPQTALADIDAYIDGAGATFETTIYGGTLEPATGPLLPDGSRIDYQVTAADPALRGVLKSLSIIVTAGTAAVDPDDRSALLSGAADQLASAQGQMTELRAALGHDQERLEMEGDAATAEIAAIDLARNTITGVDPYVAATRFTDLEGQLQSVYTVTARLAGLSLTNFLR